MRDRRVFPPMTIVLITIFLFLLFDPGVFAQGDTVALEPADSVPARPEIDRQVFRPGEKIRLRVTYLGFTAGYLSTHVKPQIKDGRKVFRLKVTGESSGLAYWFYTIRDEFVSYVDASGYFSLGYDYKQNHGGEQEFEKVRYDHDNGLFFKNGSDTGTIPPYSQDVVSALYFIRAQDLDVGDTFNFPVHVGDESYNLNIKVEAREEIATTNRGWVDSLRIKPSLQDPEQERELREKLEGEKNKVRIWITDDGLKIPVQIGVPAKIGTFWGYLVEYDPGRNYEE